MRQEARSKWGDRDARRGDLLAAGRRRLEAEGYAAFNIRAVAQDAGISPGSVYTYFANKEELFATLYAERLETLLAELEPLCVQAADLEQLFTRFLHMYLPVYRVFGQELNLWSLVLRQNGNFPPELVLQLATLAQRIMGAMFAALQRLAPAAGIDLDRLPERHLVMSLLWATANGLADHFSGDRQLLGAHQIDELAGFGIRTLVAGLQTLAPAHPTAQE